MIGGVMVMDHNGNQHPMVIGPNGQLMPMNEKGGTSKVNAIDLSANQAVVAQKPAMRQHPGMLQTPRNAQPNLAQSTMLQPEVVAPPLVLPGMSCTPSLQYSPADCYSTFEGAGMSYMSPPQHTIPDDYAVVEGTGMSYMSPPRYSPPAIEESWEPAMFPSRVFV